VLIVLGSDSLYERRWSEYSLRCMDMQAKADQRRLLDANGGAAAVLVGGVKIPYTPAPAAFNPAPVAARKRAGK